MCFSAAASLIAGGALTATGVVTIGKVKSRSEIPFASIPLFFGIQQLLEGMVWLSLQSGDVLFNSYAAKGFSFFAYVFWPVFVPIAVLMMEKDKQRKKIIAAFVALGVAIGIHTLYAVLRFPVSSNIVNESIVYGVATQFNFLTLIPYVVATCFSCLFSSHKTARVIGGLTLFFAVIAYVFYTVEFVSVWCFFAAIISLLVFDFFLQRGKSSLP